MLWLVGDDYVDLQDRKDNTHTRGVDGGGRSAFFSKLDFLAERSTPRHILGEQEETYDAFTEFIRINHTLKALSCLSLSAQSGRTTDPFVFVSTSIIRQHFLSLIIHSANKTNERHAWLVLSLILVNKQGLRDWCAKGRTLSHIIIKLNTVSYIFDELRNLAKKDKNLLRYKGSSNQLKTKCGWWPNCSMNQSLNRRALKVD